MHARRFGPLARAVPVLGIGTWKMEHDDRAAAIAAIRRAVDAGMTHVDTAEMYGSGHVEELLGEALAVQEQNIFFLML
jgi:aryl-alcohol dehydrogenase-like predicted oxidoreductase